MIDYFKKRTKKLPILCMAGHCSFSINWQGMLRLCVMLSCIEIDVFENGFINSWNFIMKEAKKLYIPEECSICKYKAICNICPASALYETGTSDIKPYCVCQLAKEGIKC